MKIIATFTERDEMKLANAVTRKPSHLHTKVIEESATVSGDHAQKLIYYSHLFILVQPEPVSIKQHLLIYSTESALSPLM